MKNALAKSFTFWSLLRFTAPTIIMMVFMSLYTMVDGIFVSRFVGTNALSAVNLVYPALSIILAIGIMLATGGSAVIARKMGEHRIDEAKQDFTFILAVGTIIGIIAGAAGLIFAKPLVMMLGANDATFQYCFDYARTLAIFAPFSILQILFQYLFVTAGKPHIGLALTVSGGLANILLDYVFIVPMNMGIGGAALATGIGFAIPAIGGIVYFLLKRKGTLAIVKPRIDFKMLLESCGNGSSEMVSNLSLAITTFMFNLIMMRYMGEDGVAAITIVLYAQFLLTALYIGYASGVSPILSYNHGQDNSSEIRKIFRNSIIFIVVSSVITFVLSFVLAPTIVQIFAPIGTTVYDIALNGFNLFSFCYLFIGINIFASAMFTAFSNGKVSAIISFLRTFLFIIVAILLLPQLMGVNGVWLAIPVAEVAALVISIGYMVRFKGVYKYCRIETSLETL